MINDTMQGRMAEWVETRGLRLYDKTERTLRFGEEAVELLQASGLPLLEVLRMIAVVYSKPVGDVHKEAGGVGITLLALAQSNGFSLAQAVNDELDRVYALPIERFRNRNRQNVADGIGQPPE